MLGENRNEKIHIELFNDHFQNFKQYGIPKAQLVIADIPYNLAENAYASSPSWYVDGDNKNGESNLAHKSFFDTDNDFRIAEFMHFCSHMLVKEPKERGKAPAMIVFCSFEQLNMVIEYGKKYGFNHYIPLFFIKDHSSQVLKANMRVVGATEFGLVLFREKLPKFNNKGRMIYDWFSVSKDTSVPRLHPTQKPMPLLRQLIEIYTDRGDTVIDPVAGSGTTLRAAAELGRSGYGFEIKKNFYKLAKERMLTNIQISMPMEDATENEVSEQTTIYSQLSDTECNQEMRQS